MQLGRMIPRVSIRLKLGVLMPLTAAALMACGGGGGGDGGSDASAPLSGGACPETGPYACRTGETEPLYTFQWALNYLRSFFQTHADAGAYGGGLDLNVEPVHRQNIKGQGVRVLVIDSGVDLQHEDLKDNADYGMSWNFVTQSSDPDPLRTGEPSAHGTNVAGIIGAAQNGKGVMGIAPRVKLGGVALILSGNSNVQTYGNFIASYGGAAWSSKADVINGSYAAGAIAQRYSLTSSATLAGVQSLKTLRGAKGIVFVKAASTAYGSDGTACRPLVGIYSCINPANDNTALEPNVIVTTALNAKGQAASYSGAGPVVWITGMGGEYGDLGRYGEASRGATTPAAAADDGPTLFTTDIQGCSGGYSQTANPQPDNPFMRGTSELTPGVMDNPNCDYSQINGTSAAAATITGVVALMLSANPNLTWRDVRDILRLSARAVDMGYEKRARNLTPNSTLPYNARFDLTANRLVNETGDKNDIAPGSTKVPVELGWVRNGAGLTYSNWYGFGVPDAAKAVELAQLYKQEPSRSRPAAQTIPAFSSVVQDFPNFKYQQVSLLGQLNNDSGASVDAFQVRLTGENICLGSLGIAVQSPSGTVSLLKMPLDYFALSGDVSEFSQYGLGSYAFYGEPAKGAWKIYAVASNPLLNLSAKWPARSQACNAATASASDRRLQVEARIIAQ